MLRLLVILLFTASILMGQDISLCRHQFYIGPEWYCVKRTKKGGTKQDGSLQGIYLGYECLKRYGWYWGSDFSYATGELDGRSGENKVKIKSHLKEIWLEQRFGYTFQQKDKCQLAFTPYIGIGYFIEKNNFVHPSPIRAHFETRYPYTAAGFLSWILINEDIELGINYKARYPFNPECRVTHDDKKEPVKQNIRERLQYRLEFPVTFRLPYDYVSAVSVVPFFEKRKYGSHPNFPFNFIKSQFKEKGVILEFMYRFN